MKRFELLNADDIHQPGDERWDGKKWVTLETMHHGDEVGEDSCPCRRIPVERAETSCTETVLR